MSLLLFCLSLVLAPLLFGIINKTKAFFGGRRGRPLFQLYFDLIKLLKKGGVYSKTTTSIFRISPLVAVATPIIAFFFIPFGRASLLSFSGDFILVIYLLALSRFFYVLAALDTGSSFEGMGGSRELQFSTIAEPISIVSLLSLVIQTQKLSLSSIYTGISGTNVLVILFVLAALFMVFLIENCRIPFDDPNTHLELTMIHEVMILDHSGVDLAYLLYGSALKFWGLGALIVGLIIPHVESPLLSVIIFLGGMFLLSVFVGIIESIIARIRLTKVPHLAFTALSFAILSIIFQLR